mgnify:CR=1 FL=1
MFVQLCVCWGLGVGFEDSFLDESGFELDELLCGVLDDSDFELSCFELSLLDEVSFLLSDFELFDFEEELPLPLFDVLVSFFWEDEFVG